tara:strand:- start:268 stop:516 length:249 start_codon:yes stop_codon:yes gene_type:complete
MVKKIIKLKKGLNLISFYLFNNNLKIILNEPRITFINNANEYYNSEIPIDLNPLDFKYLQDESSNLGYYLNSITDFDIEIET